MGSFSKPYRDDPSGPDDPDDDAGAGNERLAARLRQLIDEAGGAVDFSEFMQRVLYEPGLGYYSAGHRKFGPEGDFVTAPQMGRLFGECLARQSAEVLDELRSGDILEFGAGTGLLCVQVLESLQRVGSLPDRYYVLELSADLRERQRRTVQEHCPDLVSRCRWLDRLPERFEGIVVANEVLDAMPVERFQVTRAGLEIIQVTWTEDGFRETTRPAESGELEEIAALGLPVGYESEAGVLAERWVAGIADWLQRGVVLIIDYGFPQHEFYHLERSRGTLMCHHRHRAHTDPYRHLGMQDITAHLNFSALARRADGAGLEILGFAHQAAFLLSLGLLDLVQPATDAPGVDHWQCSQEAQRLTQSYEMGELFKVLALGKDYPRGLSGFQYLDHRERL